MKTLSITFAILLIAFQLVAQNFIDTYIHIVPDYGESSGSLFIQECFDSNTSITKTITLDGSLLPSGQIAGIDGNGIKVLHYIASNGSDTYELMANIDFNFSNPSISYILSPSVEPMSVIQTHRSSSQNCDGEINLIVSGGNAPIHINWFQNGDPISGSSGQTNLTNLCPGNYGYEFVDASTLCSGDGNMFNVSIDELSCIVMVDPISCFGVCDGVAELFPTGSNPGSMVSSVIINTIGDQDATGLYNQCEGMITGQIMDNTGGMAQCQNVIREPDLIEFNLSVENSSGSGENNGNASVDIVGGDGPYSYDWTGPNGYTNTGTSIEDLIPGSYSLEIMYNMNNCDTMVTFDIIEPSELIVTIHGTTPHTSNPPNGSVDFTISGGVPPYDTILDNGQTQIHGGPFDQLSFGNYTLKVIDSNGNRADTSFMINTLVALYANQALSSFTIYPNPASESIVVKGKDLRRGFVYDIKGSIVVNQSLVEHSEIDISHLEPGVYTVKIQSLNRNYFEKLIVQ